MTAPRRVGARQRRATVARRWCAAASGDRMGAPRHRSASSRRSPVPAAVCLDDVGDDAGDVVRSAAAQGQVDERVDRLLGVAAGQRLAQGLVADDPGQPVAAQQVAVAGAGVADRQVDLDVGSGRRGPAGSAIAAGGWTPRPRDPALVDEGLHQGVVVGDLRRARRRAAGRRASRRCERGRAAARPTAGRSAWCPCRRVPASASIISRSWSLAWPRASAQGAEQVGGGTSSSSGARAAIATALATSPAACPPMPSATASSRGPA